MFTLRKIQRSLSQNYADKAQAIVCFARQPDFGYVPVYYQAHLISRLNQALMTLHQGVAELEAKAGGERSIEFIRLSEPVQQTESETETETEAEAGAETAGQASLAMVGSNRVSDLAILHKVCVQVQKKFPARRASAASDNAFDVFNTAVDYTCLWLLFVYGARPTRQMLLRSYFVDLENRLIFLSQKDDGRYSHSTIIPITDGFIQQYKNLMRMRLGTANFLQSRGYSDAGHLTYQEALPSRVPARDTLLKSKNVPSRGFLKQGVLPSQELPVLVKISQGQEQLRVHYSLPRISALLEELGCAELLPNVGRHHLRTKSRNSDPLSSKYLPEELAKLALSHAPAGTHSFAPSSSLNSAVALTKLRRFYECREKDFGFSPRSPSIGGFV